MRILVCGSLTGQCYYFVFLLIFHICFPCLQMYISKLCIHKDTKVQTCYKKAKIWNLQLRYLFSETMCAENYLGVFCRMAEAYTLMKIVSDLWLNSSLARVKFEIFLSVSSWALEILEPYLPLLYACSFCF